MKILTNKKFEKLLDEEYAKGYAIGNSGVTEMWEVEFKELKKYTNNKLIDIKAELFTLIDAKKADRRKIVDKIDKMILSMLN